MLKLSDDIKEILLDVHWKMLRNPALSNSSSNSCAREDINEKISYKAEERWKDNLSDPQLKQNNIPFPPTYIPNTLLCCCLKEKKKKQHSKIKK